MAIGGLGLVKDQPEWFPAFGQSGQDLAGERLHDLIAAHQVIGQKSGNPLISHIPAIGLPGQPGRQLHQIGAAHVQHGSDQNRQLVALRLALPRQPLGQLCLDSFRPNRDPVRLCHDAIPRQNEGGIVASHLVATRQSHHREKLIDGEPEARSIARKILLKSAGLVEGRVE